MPLLPSGRARVPEKVPRPRTSRARRSGKCGVPKGAPRLDIPTRKGVTVPVSVGSIARKIARYVGVASCTALIAAGAILTYGTIRSSRGTYSPEDSYDDSIISIEAIEPFRHFVRDKLSMHTMMVLVRRLFISIVSVSLALIFWGFVVARAEDFIGGRWVTRSFGQGSCGPMKGG